MSLLAAGSPAPPPPPRLGPALLSGPRLGAAAVVASLPGLRGGGDDAAGQGCVEGEAGAPGPWARGRRYGRILLELLGFGLLTLKGAEALVTR
jgi:hypothetical protein